ncbi:response regulator [Candidatus Saccharibacteria bacterium]|nr:response regulator [Candidatus Saccharibacteria bacterium]MCL1962770.1 response regulator [Candidatus Saccharibacteria bacterium]
MIKILLVEDDKWFAESLVLMLKKDFELRFCSDPEAVFGVVESWQPDLLLADMILGEKNLFVLLNEMQSYADTRNINVVILTSSADSIKLRDVARFNVKKILDKSTITPEILKTVLHDCAASSRGFSRSNLNYDDREYQK